VTDRKKTSTCQHLSLLETGENIYGRHAASLPIALLHILEAFNMVLPVLAEEHVLIHTGTLEAEAAGPSERLDTSGLAKTESTVTDDSSTPRSVLRFLAGSGGSGGGSGPLGLLDSRG
jgi:hypothetical protein